MSLHPKSIAAEGFTRPLLAVTYLNVRFLSTGQVSVRFLFNILRRHFPSPRHRQLGSSQSSALDQSQSPERQRFYPLIEGRKYHGKAQASATAVQTNQVRKRDSAIGSPETNAIIFNFKSSSSKCLPDCLHSIFLGGCVPPGPENPYPILDQNIGFSIHYFRPDSQNVYPTRDPVRRGSFSNSK